MTSKNALANTVRFEMLFFGFSVSCERQGASRRFVADIIAS